MTHVNFDVFEHGANSPLDHNGCYHEFAFSPLPKDGLGIIWYTEHPTTFRLHDNPDDYEE